MNSAGEPFATLQAANGMAETRPGGIVVLKLPFDSTNAVKQARINLDTKLVPGWNEIDSVAIKGSAGFAALGGRCPREHGVWRGSSRWERKCWGAPRASGGIPREARFHPGSDQ
jgi:hypothetical protein